MKKVIIFLNCLVFSIGVSFGQMTLVHSNFTNSAVAPFFYGTSPSNSYLSVQSINIGGYVGVFPTSTATGLNNLHLGIMAGTSIFGNSSSNTFIGTYSGHNLSQSATIIRNTFTGAGSSGQAVKSGRDNSFYGAESGSGITSGNRNTYIGSIYGNNQGYLWTTGNNNSSVGSGVRIGDNSSNLNPGLDYTSILGSDADVRSSFSVTIGGLAKNNSNLGVVIGYNSFAQTFGQGLNIIGNNTTINGTGSTNNTAIGNNNLLTSNGTNNFVMGNSLSNLSFGTAGTPATNSYLFGNLYHSPNQTTIGSKTYLFGNDANFSLTIGDNSYVLANDITSANSSAVAIGSNRIILGNNILGANATLVGIGTYQPTAKMQITGVDASSANSGLIVTSSTNSQILKVRNDGNVGVNTANPTANFHSNGTVRLENLPTLVPTRTIVSDANGNLTWINGLPQTGGLTSSCSTVGAVPLWTGTGVLGCSMIQQASGTLTNCTGGGFHSGIGIGGPPVATGMSGGGCYDIALTVFGSGITSTGSLWIASDRKFKNNIKTLENPLVNILKLRGVSYNYNNEKYPEMKFSNAKTFGFIAQELQDIFPELVFKTNEDFLAVNYEGLIPVLTEAIKEQQAQIEAKDSKVEKLEQHVSELESKLNRIEEMLAKTNQLEKSSSTDNGISAGEPSLKQNSPNPFNQETVIHYFLPQNCANSILKIVDMEGTEINTFALHTGNGEQRISANSLKPGNYSYQLVCGDKIIDSKKMTITK
ncbi:MAG: tail fiber domain-containing protein [Bacteroidetes bacterium]|nr:tail fiber domain-containing protein [Bacteroidota bacterium]